MTPHQLLVRAAFEGSGWVGFRRTSSTETLTWCGDNPDDPKRDMEAFERWLATPPPMDGLPVAPHDWEQDAGQILTSIDDANNWLIENAAYVDQKARESTRRLIGRDSLETDIT